MLYIAVSDTESVVIEPILSKYKASITDTLHFMYL